MPSISYSSLLPRALPYDVWRKGWDCGEFPAVSLPVRVESRRLGRIEIVVRLKIPRDVVTADISHSANSIGERR